MKRGHMDADAAATIARLAARSQCPGMVIAALKRCYPENAEILQREFDEASQNTENAT